MAVTVETHPDISCAARALGQDVCYMAGGTLVMRAVNAGTLSGKLVRTADPKLREIAFSSSGIRLGAGATMDDILARADLAFLHPVARSIGGPQVRAMATAGGNLFAPHPYGDLAVALIALGANAVLAGGGTVTVEDLVRNRQRAALVEAIDIPRPQSQDFGWLKVSRVKPRGVSMLSIAAFLPRSAGSIRGARIAWGAMGPGPMRGNAAERALEGQRLDATSIARAAQVCTEGLDPPTDALATSWYRREVAGVHLKRLLASMA
jgi:CO/xanthine dehydrogenase FAD-binding subunit